MKTNIKKNLLYILIAVILPGLISCNQTIEKKQDIDTPEAQKLIDKWLTFWSSYDLNSIENLFWNNSNLTYFSSEKTDLIKGFKSLYPHHESFGFIPGGKKPEKSLWLNKPNIVINGKTAIVTAIWYFGDKSLPLEEQQKGPVTFVLIKNPEGNVKIAHAHFANY